MTKDEEPTFNTIYYVAKHEKMPAHNKKLTWRFQPPRHCGKRPWDFVNMTFAKAKKEAVEQMAERGRFGEFVVVP